MTTRHRIATVLLAATAAGAQAQGPAAPPAPDPSTVQAEDRSARVGDATQRLLALQRDGRAASPTPRPIAGDVATMSYQRYLDTFKRPIPEHFGTTVRNNGTARPAP
ncbi:MAG: DUF3613 domain-containing protein [Variovorax sp.]|jgi:hypothetical protein|nr:MAG: DUF3613 domain-containing protein [Variovorax sp.]